MTQQVLIALCTGDFYDGFAAAGARRVVAAGAAETLWRMVCEADTLGLPKASKEKFLFRASYIVERVYFDHGLPPATIADTMFRLMPTLTNGSAKRHWAKICHDLILKGYRPARPEVFCEALLDWAIDPRTRVAVTVWVIRILSLLAAEEPWLADTLPDLLHTLSRNPTPGLRSALKRL